MRTPCSISTCSQPRHARELCTRHYQRWKAHGDPLLGEVTGPRVCSVCDSDISGRRSNAVTCSPACKAKAADRRRNQRPSAILRKEARRSKKLGNPGYVHISASEWRGIVNRHQGRCAYCATRPARLQMDHVIPLARDGRHAPANVVPACGPCNRSKSSSLLVEWRHRRERG